MLCTRNWVAGETQPRMVDFPSPNISLVEKTPRNCFFRDHAHRGNMSLSSSVSDSTAAFEGIEALAEAHSAIKESLWIVKTSSERQWNAMTSVPLYLL
jgi:hypothetical protein